MDMLSLDLVRFCVELSFDSAITEEDSHKNAETRRDLRPIVDLERDHFKMKRSLH